MAAGAESTRVVTSHDRGWFFPCEGETIHDHAVPGGVAHAAAR
jgi:hypothetical protein